MPANDLADWRSLWTVDLETATATHRDGWQFQFAPAGEPGEFDGESVAQPKPLTPEHLRVASRIAREAGEVFLEARNNRH